MVKRVHIDYSVGYGRPPKRTQFKKGQSGNPRGRPKGSLNIATVLERTLREQVVVTERGRRKTITKLDAAVKQLVNKAASGDAGAIRFLIDIVRVVEDRFAHTAPVASDLPEADRQVMNRILGRIQQITKEGVK